MRYKLPSNWANWRLQGRFQSLHATESRVTGNAEASRTVEISSIRIWQVQSNACYRDDAMRIYELCAIRVDRHCWPQLQSRLTCIRLDGVINVMDAVSFSSGYRYQTEALDDGVQDSGAVIADHATVPNGK